MVVCQFYLRGQCRFGSACRNEHPKDAVKSGQTPFTAESIKKDLTPDDGKPLWPLSSYGPAKGEKTLIGGLDESPEELRFMAWQVFRSRDPMQLEGYKTYEVNKIAAALAAHKNAEMNSMDAFKAAFEASRTASSAFGEDRQRITSASGFGQPSSSPFGQFPATSAFSQPKSVFGQPSAFNQPSNASPAFGQLSSTTSSAFGPGGVGSGKSNFALGQPTFGQPSSPFSKPAGSPVFGQVGFAQPAFGQPTRPSAFNAVGTPAPSLTTAPVFGQPTFNQPPASGSSSMSPATGFGAFAQSQQNQNQTQLQNKGSGFSAFAGKPATFGQHVNTFGAQSTGSTSAFGTPLATTSSTNALPVHPFSSAPRSAFSSTPPTLKMDEATPNTNAFTKSNAQPSNYSASNDPYAATLPENYKEIIPKRALDAFEDAEFSWGYVPEWIPPVSMR